MSMTMKSTSLTSNTLQDTYGKAYTPQEFASFLEIDPRTVIKYYRRWGGIEVSPGKFRFFENIIKEVLENAKQNHQTGSKEMERQFNVKWSKTGQVVSRQYKEISSGSCSMGKGNPEYASKEHDPHGLLDYT